MTDMAEQISYVVPNRFEPSVDPFQQAGFQISTDPQDINAANGACISRESAPEVAATLTLPPGYRGGATFTLKDGRELKSVYDDTPGENRVAVIEVFPDQPEQNRVRFRPPTPDPEWEELPEGL